MCPTVSNHSSSLIVIHFDFLLIAIFNSFATSQNLPSCFNVRFMKTQKPNWHEQQIIVGHKISANKISSYMAHDLPEIRPWWFAAGRTRNIAGVREPLLDLLSSRRHRRPDQYWFWFVVDQMGCNLPSCFRWRGARRPRGLRCENHWPHFGRRDPAKMYII